MPLRKNPATDSSNSALFRGSLSAASLNGDPRQRAGDRFFVSNRFGDHAQAPSSHRSNSRQTCMDLFRELEFPMDARTEDRNGAAIAIEGRIGNELVIQDPVNLLGEFVIVVRLQCKFPAVVQVAIAVQNA